MLTTVGLVAVCILLLHLVDRVRVRRWRERMIAQAPAARPPRRVLRAALRERQKEAWQHVVNVGELDKRAAEARRSR